MFETNGTAIDVGRLAARLAEVPVGGEIGYAEIRDLIGTNPQNSRGRGIVERARRAALREHRCVFRCITNVGLRRLTDEEVSATVPTELRQTVRRKARRASKELVSVDYDALTPEAKVRHNVGLSVAGALTQATAEATRKRLEQACEKTTAALSLKTTLELFEK